MGEIKNCTFTDCVVNEMPQDDEYIRAAVSLAEGWRLQNEILVIHTETNLWMFLDRHVQQILDALAAQLVRMVDALPEPTPMIIASATAVSVVLPDETFLMEGNNNGRSMNTIKAIVDSGVLGCPR